MAAKKQAMKGFLYVDDYGQYLVIAADRRSADAIMKERDDRPDFAEEVPLDKPGVYGHAE